MVIRISYSEAHPTLSGAYEVVDVGACYPRPWQRISVACPKTLPGMWAVVIETASQWVSKPGTAEKISPDWHQTMWILALSGCKTREEYENELSKLVDRIEVDGEVWWNASKAFAAHVGSTR